MCSWKRLLLLACTASLIVNVASDDDAAVQGTVDTQATGNTGETEATGDTPGTDSSCGCGGDVNARPGCGTHCINCSNYKKKPVVCPDICYPNGCDCRDGFIYDPNLKECVLPQVCTPTCGANEVYNACINGGCDARNCSQVGKPVPCVKLDPKACINGCICKEGYLRASNGTCVPKDQCKQPPTCKKDEVYTDCKNRSCTPYTCSELGFPLNCDSNCKPGCVCKGSLVRAANGTCVPQDQCPSCGGDENAGPGCGTFCINCSNYNKKGVGCPDICILNGCACKNGFIYDRNVKKCVLPTQCTPTCEANEVYNACINGGCDARNCSQVGKPVPCVRLDPKACIKGCICKEGYLRASNGTCVPKDQCKQPPTCGANEVYNACINGGCDARNCSQVGKPVPCVKLDPKACINGCICKEGYLRASNGTCVPKDQCEQPQCNKPNEVYDVCPAPCPPRRCDVDDRVIRCAAPPKPGDPACQPGCRCADGYARNATGTCVLRCHCEKPLQCKANEVYDSCPAICPPQVCSLDSGPIFCPRNPNYGDPGCKPACRCIDGYLRNAANVCIPKDKCPKCGDNEVYNSCINGGCDARNCSQLNRPVPCIDPIKCIEGCVCAKGYLRNSDGKCVPTDQCGSATPSCPNGEFYDKCPTVKCDGDYCPKTRNSPQTCPVGIVCDPPRCTCGFNQKRDWKTGKCIAISNCPPFACNGPNEEYQPCPASCPGENCTDYINDSKCPPFKIGIVVPCKPQCKCKTGYFRNTDGVCIIGSKCGPKKSTTTTTTTPAPSDLCPGQNEFFDTCIKGCSNQTCDSIGTIYHCPLQTTVCKTGCRCKPGFYRDSNNVCVEQSQCPQQCGENAYYEKCYLGCSNQTCNEIGVIYACPAIIGCKSLCRCNPGFWRDKDNKCIAESQCPTPPCPEGEVYNRCATVKCDGDYCPKTRDCPQTCKAAIACSQPRCTCGFNQKRDWKTGKCIATRDCPPFACDGPNEEYQPCPAFCPGDNCKDYINDSKCPPGRIGIVLPCRPQCKCKTGYFRNSDGVCIIGSKCGPKKSTTTTTKTPINNCDQSTTAVTTPKPTSGDSGSIVASLQAGVTTFTGKFLYDRISASPGENIIISAYSVLTPLSQLALYATGVTLSQLLAVLNVKNKDDIRTGFPALAASYEGQTSVNFSVAAEVLSNINYKLSDAFIKDSQHIFKADAKSIDFADNVKAAADINAWVESKTNDRIKNLVSADMFSAMTRMVLVNAIYFKGTWKYQFDTKNTNDADFYLSDGSTKKTKLMYQKGSFRYGEIGDLDCKVIELPYVGLNFTMFIVLPNKNDGVLETANKLRDSATFNKAYESMYSQTVEVYLPQFEITTSTNLADILKKQNVDQMFNPNDSGLSGILEKPEQVYVSEAVQKAYIKCDETGSEAAAANGVTGRSNLPAPPPPPPKQFRADHAFLFYIRVKTVTVFCGAYIN
ncbi:uncharacterized protein [Choristoneura fumiferana]|uniref:uncharacterized protein n=1 Tax=Choristoneura fumiferana TaxID=7141 RepID=UPI003D1581C1